MSKLLDAWVMPIRVFVGLVAGSMVASQPVGMSLNHKGAGIMFDERIEWRSEGGRFVARLSDVVEKLGQSSKREMVRECCDLWPELLRDGSWSRAYLRSLPSFVLAIILKQI